MKSRIACFALILGALALPFVLSGCASIMHGTTQDIEIMSTPAEAEVEVSSTLGQVCYTGMTPATASLERKYDYKVKINLSGYREEEVWINKTTSGAVWGNLICGGIIGLAIDFSNGAAYQLTPEEVNVSLVTASLGNGDTETYAVLRQLNDDGELQTMILPLTRL